MGMFGVAQYPASYASVRARLARLLSPAEWADLLAARDVPEFVQRLAEMSYRDVTEFIAVDRATDQAVDLPRLERALRGHLARASRLLIHFVPEGARRLLRWRWRRFEVDNLKTVLRAVERGVDPERAMATLVPLGADSELAWDRLLNAGSVRALVEELEGTFYGETLEPAVETYCRQACRFVLEVTLDLAYFRRLQRLIKDLSGRDRKEAERFLGTMIDSQNVLWAFRYRVYYDLSLEEILNYTLHRGVKVDISTIRRIARGAGVLDILRDVWDGRLPGLERLEDMSDKEALAEAERIFDRYLFDEAQRVRRRYSMHLGLVLGYEVLLETEVNDLVRVAEGKAAKWAAEQIRPYLMAAHR
jgi:V/A-type H+-transporting ATPase subunit C